MVSELEMLARLVLAVVLGALIGLDRETRNKPAGLRTFAIVSLGACIFTLVGVMAFTGAAETSRVVSTIITGVGFLGAGTIIQRRSGVSGLTTAAGILGLRRHRDGRRDGPLHPGGRRHGVDRRGPVAPRVARGTGPEEPR